MFLFSWFECFIDHFICFFGIIEGPAQVPWPAGAVQQNIDD